MNKGCVTIYTDASVCSNTCIGGWAAWVKTAPGESALFNGAFRMPVKCTTDAEIRAIVNGLAAAKKMMTTQKLIVVVTDSASAKNLIERVKDRKSPAAGFKQKAIDANMFKLARLVWLEIPEGCELRVNKVKAHSGKDGKRSYCNGKVDVASREAMRAARATKAKEAAQ